MRKTAGGGASRPIFSALGSWLPPGLATGASAWCSWPARRYRIPGRHTPVPVLLRRRARAGPRLGRDDAVPNFVKSDLIEHPRSVACGMFSSKVWGRKLRSVRLPLTLPSLVWLDERPANT